MSKFLGYTFKNTFHECNIDQKTCSFVVYISENESQEKIDEFVAYWKTHNVPITFLRVIDTVRSAS